ncbi:HNH endonuclease [Priestia megaterium]|uniref:HNH endonuclease signature motif containing protein n=1 Tax=Priestia megaterium TaxID=1404 RepID=UPI002EBDA6BF|nr:HNH endonuclease [Priestia megaterium]
MLNEFNPVPKPVKVDKKLKPYMKKNPKKNKKPKKNTNVTMYHNRKIPHWKQRGEVPRKQGNEALRHYGEYCAVCGNPEFQLHHIVHKGYGIGGRGRWRNLVPLCLFHHTGEKGVHTIAAFDQYWKDLHEKKFGPHYYKDQWDLWMEGLISSPTETLFERFMQSEEERLANIGGN